MLQGFQWLLSKIRDWLNSMIPTTNLKSALGVDVALTPAMTTALQLWSAMYINQPPWADGENGIKPLNLPAAIAGEIARAVTIELKIEISGSARADFLNEQFEYILPRLREMVEYGNAKGGLMFKPYVTAGGLAVDYVQADCFYPISFDANGCITACVFSDQRKIGQWYYTRLEYHTFSGNACEIRNAAFRSSSIGDLGQAVPLNSVDVWADLLPEATVTNIDRPLFAYFKFPQANNIDPISPLGVSCYARATDLIRQADGIWNNLIWEFESGKRAIYVDQNAFGKDVNGKPVLPTKRLYRELDSNANIGEGKKRFDEWSPEFREAAIKSGLNDVLRQIEFNCGLAYGTLSDPNVEANTATEIKMQKQRSFATITDTQKSLETALDNLLYAMDTWATLFNLAPRGTYTVTYDFDDSIVSDHDTQFVQDSQVVTMSAMPKYRFLMRNLGLSEVDAKQWVEEAQAENPPIDLFGQAGNAGGNVDMPPDNANMPNAADMPMNNQGA